MSQRLIKGTSWHIINDFTGVLGIHRAPEMDLQRMYEYKYNFQQPHNLDGSTKDMIKLGSKKHFAFGMDNYK